MCLVIIAWRVHPDYRLVVAANRDEFRHRLSSPAHWWTDQASLLAGRDLEAGGTWMGLNRDGRFAALTNYRDPSGHKPGAPSRGVLVSDCLNDHRPALDTLHSLAAVSPRYVGFNMLLSDGNTLGIHESSTGVVRALDAGIYGLSNRVLDTDWPKLRRAKTAFEPALSALPDAQAMLALLRDDQPAPDDELPHTGVSMEWERLLSPIFIRAPEYGTRCSSLITVRHDGETRFSEWTWDEHGALHSEVVHCFRASR